MCHVSIALALLVIVFLVLIMRPSEGVKDKRNFKLYTSGATMRRVGSSFSSANQVQPVVLHVEGKTVPLYLGYGTAQGGIVNPDLGGISLAGNDHFYTSGATMRDLDQVFSSSDQAPSVEIHNMDDPDTPPMYLQAALIGK